MKKTLLFVLLAAAAFSAEGYKILNKIKVGGTGGWDYLSVDPAEQNGFTGDVLSTAVALLPGRIAQHHRLRSFELVFSGRETPLPGVPAMSRPSTKRRCRSSA